MDFMIKKTLELIENGKVPDSVIRAGIKILSKKRLAQEGRFNPPLAALYGCADHAEKQRNCH